MEAFRLHSGSKLLKQNGHLKIKQSHILDDYTVFVIVIRLNNVKYKLFGWMQK